MTWQDSERCYRICLFLCGNWHEILLKRGSLLRLRDHEPPLLFSDCYLNDDLVYIGLELVLPLLVNLFTNKMYLHVSSRLARMRAVFMQQKLSVHVSPSFVTVKLSVNHFIFKIHAYILIVLHMGSITQF